MDNPLVNTSAIMAVDGKGQVMVNELPSDRHFTSQRRESPWGRLLYP
jgi:hypothetical protein